MLFKLLTTRLHINSIVGDGEKFHKVIISVPRC